MCTLSFYGTYLSTSQWRCGRAFLKNKVLPELHSKLALNPLRIWSAAASSGEEIYSLYLLATYLNVKTQCIASDINTAVLEKCQKGEYTPNSIRIWTGQNFMFSWINSRIKTVPLFSQRKSRKKSKEGR